MNFEPTQEQRQLVDSVHSVLAKECPTSLVRDIVESGSAPEQPWKSARELGWTSIDLPDSVGGLALGFTTLGLVIEQHGGCIAPGPFLATVSQFLPLVCEAGAPGQLERFAASRNGPVSAFSFLAVPEHGCGAHTPIRPRFAWQKGALAAGESGRLHSRGRPDPRSRS